MPDVQVIRMHEDTIRIGSLDSAVDRVASFFGAYVDTVFNGTDPFLAKRLRAHYLTHDLQCRLAAWEETNPADGVLRAQRLPTKWDVRYRNSDAVRALTTVTLAWDVGPEAGSTQLVVESELRTKLIADISAMSWPMATLAAGSRRG
ncbi:hypothetical protein ACFC0M_24915 [Streptomyces sp. NPDC056149]|uniref:hypothetical protein n=1 Tax=unclassified Streptomyces TaxID=2593676 RepID=UPI002380C511|nr:hypothetical protein [Streptomyces sp. WZ-12]